MITTEDSMHRRRQLFSSSIGLALAAFCAMGTVGALVASAPAQAQADKPPLRLLVGFPPGGSADTMARLLAERLPAHLGGQGVVVENKPGAAGRIAIDALKNSAPDGNTVIVMPSGPVVLFPHVYKKLNYDPVKDLAPISQLANIDFCVVSGPKSNVKNVAEMVAKAKADPSTASFGSSGNGTVPHFLGLMMSEAAGIELQHVPYQGGAPAMTAVLGGHIGYTMDVVVESLEQHRAGKVRIIAVAGARRVPQLPDVPTLREQGVPLDAGAWFAMYGPGGLPAATAQRLSAAVAAALKEPALQARMNGLGLEPVGNSPEQLAAVQQRDLAMWAKPVKASGFQAD
jgi:tripartite-type tricarboxylate transporter receptor subunit TctC